jgi:hypothetical protein
VERISKGTGFVYTSGTETTGTGTALEDSPVKIHFPVRLSFIYLSSRTNTKKAYHSLSSSLASFGSKGALEGGKSDCEIMVDLDEADEQS